MGGGIYCALDILLFLLHDVWHAGFLFFEFEAESGTEIEVKSCCFRSVVLAHSSVFNSREEAGRVRDPGEANKVF